MPSNCVWRGDSPALAQANTVTPATVAIGNTFTLTINGKAITFTATVATVANVTAGLAAAVLATTIPEFLELVPLDIGTALVLTGPADGTPFTQTSAAAGGGATLVTSTTTAPLSPHDWSLAANWSTGAVPVTGDSVYLQFSASGIFFGLAQSAVTLAAIYQDSTYTGELGLAKYNKGQGAPYREYRPTELAISFTLGYFGMGGGSPFAGSGSGRTQINAGSVQFTANIISTGQPSEAGWPALVLRGTHASNAINGQQGNVGVAMSAAEAATLLTVKIGYLDQPATDFNLTIGDGATLSSCTITQNGGTLRLASNLSSILMNGGSLTTLETAAVTTLNVQKGHVSHESSGTITTFTVGAAGALDFARAPAACTATNGTVQGGGTLNDPNRRVTYSNPISFPDGVGGQNGAIVNWGTNFSLQRS